MDDPFQLVRFVTAQAGGPWSTGHETARREIAAGAKSSHWMWYIFPQFAGLGLSPTAEHYAIRSLDEARAYLAHPVLGARLVEMVTILQSLPASATAERVFGSVDALKLRSSLTLFAAAGGAPVFEAALIRWCGGPDPRTLALLAAADAGSRPRG